MTGDEKTPPVYFARGGQFAAAGVLGGVLHAGQLLIVLAVGVGLGERDGRGGEGEAGDDFRSRVGDRRGTETVPESSAQAGWRNEPAVCGHRVLLELFGEQAQVAPASVGLASGRPWPVIASSGWSPARGSTERRRDPSRS